MPRYNRSSVRRRQRSRWISHHKRLSNNSSSPKPDTSLLRREAAPVLLKLTSAKPHRRSSVPLKARDAPAMGSNTQLWKSDPVSFQETLEFGQRPRSRALIQNPVQYIQSSTQMWKSDPVTLMECEQAPKFQRSRSNAVESLLSRSEPVTVVEFEQAEFQRTRSNTVNHTQLSKSEPVTLMEFEQALEFQRQRSRSRAVSNAEIRQPDEMDLTTTPEPYSPISAPSSIPRLMSAIRKKSETPILKCSSAPPRLSAFQLSSTMSPRMERKLTRAMNKYMFNIEETGTPTRNCSRTGVTVTVKKRELSLSEVMHRLSCKKSRIRR